MKTLLLLRHAKSSWSDEGISDIDRPLKKSGVQNAIEVAEKLKLRKVLPDLIISSPAVRAVSTALIFARTLSYPYQGILLNEMVYDFSKEALLTLIHNLDDNFDNVMMVGHDPALTHLLNHLSGKAFEKIPTASVACIQFNVKHWQKTGPKNGKFLFIESPGKEEKTEAE